MINDASDDVSGNDHHRADNAIEIECDSNRGRPSIAKQIEIEEKNFFYFCRGVSAATAAKKLKINRKTVNKYYRKFSVQRIDATEKEFMEQCKINIQTAEEAISELILTLQESRDKLEENIGSLTKLPSFSFKTYLAMQKELRETVKAIANLIALKTNLANSPTFDLRLARHVREMIEKIAA